MGNKCLIFSRTAREAREFADLSRVVIEGLRWLGKRVERLGTGSRTD